MALTTLDLLAEPARVKAAKDEFARTRAKSSTQER
jgi:hypothetical protein